MFLGLAAGAVVAVVAVTGVLSGGDSTPRNIVPAQSAAPPEVETATLCDTQFGTCPLRRDMPPGTPCDCTNASGEVLASGNAR